MNNSTRAQFLAPNAVRIIHAQDDGTFPPDRAWLSHILLPTSTLTPDQASIVGAEKNGCVQLRTRDGAEFFAEAHAPRVNVPRAAWDLTLDIPKTAVSITRERVDDGVSLSLAIAPGEGFYGWGEWFDALRRERGSVRLKTRDAISPIQHRATYSALPFFLSTRGYGFILLNSHASAWRLNPAAGTLDIAADGPGVDYVVIYGPAFRDIISTYTALTGRPPLIPRWAFGLFVTGYPQEHQRVVLDRVLEHRRRDIPLDAVIVDYHWEEAFHNFRWRAALFPDPDEFIAELGARGVRLGLILTPFVNHRNRPAQRFLLNALSKNIPRGLEHADTRALPEYDEARAQGLFAHDDAEWWLGAGGMMDFANSAAAAWWNAHLRPLYERGVAFVKNDDGEHLPRDAHSAIGMEGREYHNLYGFFYSRALYDGQAALDERRPFIYARSAWLGSQRYPALFLGDQHPTFAHIQSTMRAGLNMSLMGFAYWTADVFGLDGKTTPETHSRYAQWALLVPVARYFWRPPEIDDTRFPWSHDAQVEENFRRYADLRYRLLPYYYTLARQAYDTGLPLMRPMLLEFQDDARFGDVYDQVMLGDRVLLAPVVEAGATARRVLLPEGLWHDFWSAQSYEGGGEITYPAPLDRLPLFVRGGNILPMGRSLQHIRDDHRFTELSLHCYPPYPAQCVLYDDDGCTRAYQRGEFSTTRVAAESDGRGVRVRIEPARGEFDGAPARRQLQIVLHRVRPPARVEVDGQSWDGWEYQSETKRAVISFGHQLRIGIVVDTQLSQG